MVAAAHGHTALEADPRMEVGGIAGEGIGRVEEHHTVLVEVHVRVLHRAAVDIGLAGDVRRRAAAEGRDCEAHRMAAAGAVDSRAVVGFAGYAADNLAVDHSQEQARPHSLAEDTVLAVGVADNPLGHVSSLHSEKRRCVTRRWSAILRIATALRRRISHGDGDSDLVGEPIYV